MLLFYVLALTTAAQETQPAATTGVASQAPSTAINTNAPASTPKAPEPSPTAGILRQQPAATAPTGVSRFEPTYFADFRPNTALDMVGRVPGFTLVVGDKVRGFAGGAGNVLIDGERPTAKQDDLQSIIKRIPASQVDHIDIIRGGAPGIDMQGQTVIANIVLKATGGVSGLLGVADSVFSHNRHTPTIRFEGSRRWSDGRILEGSAVVGGFVDDGTDDGSRVRFDPAGHVIQRADVRARAGGDQETFTAAYGTPLLGGKFRINGSLLLQGFDDDEDDTLTAPQDQVGLLSTLRDRQNKLQSELGLHYERALAPKWGLETLLIQQYNTQDYTSHYHDGEDDLFAESDTSGESIGRAVVRYRPSEKLQAEFAAEGAYNFLDTRTRYDVDGQPQDLPAANVRVEETRGEASGQATWRPSGKLTLEGGMRLEVSTIASSGDVDLGKTLTYPKPRLVATWSPTKDDQLRLRVEREVGQLDFRDFVASSALSTGQVQAGNPDLVPQRDWVFEGAYERHFMGDGDAVITLRHLVLQDVVDRVPFCDDQGQNCFDSPGNIGSGAETDLLLSLTVPLDRLLIRHGQLKGTGTFRRSEVTDPTTGESRRISGQHPFDYELHFTQDLPRWKVTWGVDLFNRWTETYYRFNEVDRYALKAFASAYIQWKPDPTLSIKAEVDNFTGRGFQRTIYAYPGARNLTPLQYVDDRQLDDHPSVYFVVRKTLGG